MCEIENDWTDPKTWALLNHVVILDTIYFNVQHLGLPIRYVTLDNIRGIIHPKAIHNYYLIEKPKDYVVIPSFASDNILKHGIGSMSGIHCQTGQEDTIYVIKKFTPDFEARRNCGASSEGERLDSVVTQSTVKESI